jgi:hypothetical protein
MVIGSLTAFLDTKRARQPLTTTQNTQAISVTDLIWLGDTLRNVAICAVVFEVVICLPSVCLYN